MFRMNCLVVLELIKVNFASSNLSEMSCFAGFLAIREAIWKRNVSGKEMWSTVKSAGVDACFICQTSERAYGGEYVL